MRTLLKGFRVDIGATWNWVDIRATLSSIHGLGIDTRAISSSVQGLRFRVDPYKNLMAVCCTLGALWVSLQDEPYFASILRPLVFRWGRVEWGLRRGQRLDPACM